MTRSSRYYAVVNVRQNPQWIVQVREAYVLRRQNVALRPPGTYAEQVRVMRNVSITRDITVVDHRNMAMPLHQLAADPIAGRNLRLVRVSEAERRTIQRQAAELHRMRQQRATLEREVARGGGADRPRTVSVPHSPVAAHPAEHTAGHPGGNGARATVAHRDEAARERETGRAEEERGRAQSGAAEAHRAMPAGRAPAAAAGRRPARTAAAPRGRARPAPERESDRRPER